MPKLIFFLDFCYELAFLVVFPLKPACESMTEWSCHPEMSESPHLRPVYTTTGMELFPHPELNSRLQRNGRSVLNIILLD